MLATVLAIAVSLTGLILLGSRISAAAQQHLYFDQVIWKKDTPYQSLTMTQSYSLNKDALSDDRVTVYNMDAFNFIKDAELKYDRVIIDMPDPHNEAISKLYAVEFYAMISRKMTEQGIVISQSSSPYFAKNAFWCVGNTLGEIFPETRALQVTTPSFGVWGFQAASKRVGRLDEPFEFAGVKTRFWTPQVARAAKVFGKDIAKPAPGQKGDPVNTIFDPIIYHLYLKDVTTSAIKRSPES